MFSRLFIFSTHLSPGVSVLGGHDTNSRSVLGQLVDAQELLLQFGSSELLAIDLMEDLEELVLANNSNVLVVVGSILLGVIGRLSRDAAAVEHVLVTAHGNGQLLHVLGFESALNDLLPEVKDRRGNGGSSLCGVSSLAVIAVAIEVRDVGDDGITVAKVCSVVPPLVDPVLDVGVFSPCDQALLQGLAEAVGSDEVVDGLFGLRVLLLAQQRVYRSQVALCRLFQCGYGQTWQRVLEAEHRSL